MALLQILFEQTSWAAAYVEVEADHAASMALVEEVVEAVVEPGAGGGAAADGAATDGSGAGQHNGRTAMLRVRDARCAHVGGGGGGAVGSPTHMFLHK